ncbi:adenine phosphoribosyltransferase [bacterium]|nr:adenine phosphoribosyltransferase [bacterium]
MIEKLKGLIRAVPDFPKEGIVYRDITTLLKDPEGLKGIIDIMAEDLKDIEFDKILGIESRGFIFGAALAYKLGKGLVLVRKKGKLPAETISAEYELEYGSDVLEVHRDAVSKGENIVIIDDLLATGGTAHAVCELASKLGANIKKIVFAIELPFLKARETKLSDYDVVSYLEY